MKPIAAPPSSDTLEIAPGEYYDERVFRYLLGAEKARAAKAGRSLRLLMVSVGPSSGTVARRTRAADREFFSALATTLRDTDIVGWYQQDAVAGAILNEPIDVATAAQSHGVAVRVETALRGKLDLLQADSIHVRVAAIDPADPVDKVAGPGESGRVGAP